MKVIPSIKLYRPYHILYSALYCLQIFLMIETVVAILFVLGYAAIAFEQQLRINKTATALLLGVLCWFVFSLSNLLPPSEILTDLTKHLSSIASIVFFLMGAMTIVELIDVHQGFRPLTNLIRTNSKRKLLWLICLITFFLSAVMDNLTTTIVMISILRKLLDDKNDRQLFACMIVIAANAGGAFSPIGDVTTTMLWIGGQVSALNIVKQLFLPSLVALVVPLIYHSFFIKGNIQTVFVHETKNDSSSGGQLIFYLGMCSLVMVPVFTHVTHLPPYMAMMLALAVLWLVTEILHSKKEERKHLKVAAVLNKIDLSSLLFFVGILLAVDCLQSMNMLNALASWLEVHIQNQTAIITSLGLSSSVIDNVPLVAATMGMYPLSLFGTDHQIWEMIAYCAGTGGSLLIIGSAAGVVAMGMEKINFIWYLRRISFTAALGYFGGLVVYLMSSFLSH